MRLKGVGTMGKNKPDRLLALGQAANACVRILSENGDLHERLQRVLDACLPTTGVSRVYISQKEDDPAARVCMTQICEACAEGVEPQLENAELQHLPYAEATPALLARLRAREPYAHIVSDLQGPEREILEARRILSILIEPIFADGSLWGFIGFDDCETSRVWGHEEIKILQAVADVAGMAISREQQIRDVERRSAFERLVSKLHSHLAKAGAGALDEALEDALEQTGRFFGADRAYLFQFRNNATRMDNTHEWCAEEIKPQIGNRQDIEPAKELPWFAQQIAKGTAIHVPSVADLPHEADLERKQFEEQDIQSLLVVPMKTSGRITGFFGFDAVKRARTWTEDDRLLLRFMADTLAGALLRIRGKDSLKARIKELTCLSGVRHAVHGNTSIEDACRSIIPHIIQGMQFPEITEVLIRAGSLVFASEGDVENLVHGLHEDIRPNEEAWGRISVFYTRPEPFLPEEQQLVEAIAIILAHFLERKQAQAALQTERDLLQTVINAPRNMHLVYLDRDFNFVTVNEAYAATCGYTPEEMVGKNHFALYPHPENEAIFARVRDTGEPFEVRDKPFQFPDQPGRGVTYWDWTLAPQKDPAGWVTGFVFTLVETTARKQAEKALAKQLRFEQAIAQTSERLLSAESSQPVVADFLTPLLEASAVSRVYIFENFNDLSDGLCMRQTYEVCAPGIHPEIDNPVLQHLVYSQGFERWRQVLAAGDPIRGHVSDFPHDERKIIEPQGILSLLVLPIFVEGNWWGFVGFDETRRPRDWQDSEVVLLWTVAEMLGAYFARKQAEDALRESENRLRQIFETNLAVKLIIDPATGRIVDANEAACRFYGYDLPELTQLRIMDINVLSEAEVRQEMERARTEERLHFDFRHRLASGEIRDVEVCSGPLQEAHKTLLYSIIHDVTDRRRAEEALRRNTQLLNETGDMARVGGWEIDLENNTVFWTHTTKVIHEVPDNYVPTLEEAIDFFPDAKDELTEAVRRAREEGVPYDLEVPFLTAKGRKLWTHTIGQPDFQDGRCLRLHGTFQDITEQRNTRVALQNSEARYKRLAENAPAVVFQFHMAPDGAFSFPFITQSVQAFMGVSADDVKRDAHALLGLIDPGQWKAFQQAVIESARNLSPYKQELHVQRKGESAWVLACSSPERQADGSVLWDGFFQDITKRKQVEEALKREHTMLARTESVAHVGSWDWEAKSDRVTWSDELFRIFGLKPAEVAPSFAEHQAFYLPEDRKRLNQAVEECLKSGVSYNLEVRIRRADGDLRHCIVRGFPMPATDGTIKRLYGSLHDITERKQAEEALREEREQLLSIFNSVDAVIYISDPTTHEMLYANRFIQEQLPTDYIGAKCYKVLQNLDAPCPFCTNDIILKQKPEPYHWEFHNKNFDRYYAIVDRIIRWTDGRDVRFEMAIDITDRKRMERQYEVLANIIQRSHDFIGVADLSKKPFFVNPAGQKMVGLKGDEEVARTKIEDYFLPEDLSFFNNTIIPTLTQQGRWAGEFRFRHFKTGKAVPVLYDLFLSEDPSTGEMTNYATVTRDITERKLAEEALRESEQRLSLATRSAALGIWDWDVVNNKMTWDDQMFRLYGITEPPKSYGVEIWEKELHPEDRDFAWEACQAALRGEKEYDIEFRVCWPDGTVRNIRAYGLVLRDDAGNPVRMLGINFDITEHRQAEQALRESEKQKNLILNTTTEMVAYYDQDLHIIWANRAAAESVDLTVEALVGRRCHEVWQGRAEPCDPCPVLQAKQEKQPCENEAQTPDGRYWLLRGYPVLDEKNQLTNLVEFGLDITERKQAEASLRAAERRNQSLLDHSPACHKIVDLDLNLQYISKNGFLMLKLDEDTNVYGKPYPFAFFPEAFRRGMKDRLEQVKATKKTLTFEGLANDIKGNDLWLYSTLVPVLNEDHDLEFITVVTADLTQQKHLENELRQSQKMESVGRLAGGVAHDFNNMLNVILGHTEMALEILAPDSPLGIHLQEILNAAERSANMTRQLLAFARKQTISPKELNLNEVITSMLKILRRLIGEDIGLSWSPGARLPLIRIDPGQVDQMLANLAVNARDAIGHQNGKVTIETANVCFDEDYCADHAGFVPGNYVMLAFSDDGCGMDEETRSHIFEPFFTTKGTGEGTGLGLATIYGIVKQNDGFVNVYSEPGKGTTFRIYLPHLKAEPRQQDDVRNTAAAPAGGNETILIVEDETAILDMTRAMLESMDYTVLTATTPSEALRMTFERTCKIDLLITDVIMPEMNGLQLTKSLHERCPSVRTLFMSGYTADVIAHHGVLEKGVNFIQKPFSRKQLAAKVREVLDA